MPTTAMSSREACRTVKVHVIGTTDRTRTFHPIAIGVSSGEGTEDYAFIFDAIKNAAKSIFDEDFKPAVIVADAAAAITAAASRSFPGIPRVVCWAHVYRAVQKKLSLIKDSDKRELLLDDISALQLAPCKEAFISATQRFLEKWSSPETDDFLDYFK